ncbi:UMP kinase, partial [Candidatus Dependentiae bacterium]
MMKTILIKFSGELFGNSSDEQSSDFLKNIAFQIKELQKNYIVGIVLGAGNIFRGNQHGKKLGLKNTTSHSIGMVATIINGLILQDILQSLKIPCALFSAIECQQISCVIKQSSIDKALNEKKCLIFVGGTGNPFFTTDTNSVLRALQIGANQVWKATKV